MPTVRVTRNTALGDGRAYTAGETVDMTGPQVQDAVAGGWGEVVRGDVPETPEGATKLRRAPRAERRAS